MNPPDSLKYGREESLAQLEHNVVLVANWLTYFDDFQLLPPNLQVIKAMKMRIFQYLLSASNGSRNLECLVEIETISLFVIRDQKELR